MAVRNLTAPGWERSRISRRRVGLWKWRGLVVVSGAMSVEEVVEECLSSLIGDWPGGRGVASGGWGAMDWVEVGKEKIWLGFGAGEVRGMAMIAI